MVTEKLLIQIDTLWVAAYLQLPRRRGPRAILYTPRLHKCEAELSFLLAYVADVIIKGSSKQLNIKKIYHLIYLSNVN